MNFFTVLISAIIALFSVHAFVFGDIGISQLNQWRAVSASYLTPINSTYGATINGPTTLATTTATVLNGVMYVDGVHYARTSAGTQAAVRVCENLGVAICSEVHLPTGAYTFSSAVERNSNIRITGDGRGTRITNSAATSTFVVLKGESTISNMHILLTNAGGVGVEYYAKDQSIVRETLQKVWIEGSGVTAKYGIWLHTDSGAGQEMTTMNFVDVSMVGFNIDFLNTASNKVLMENVVAEFSTTGIANRGAILTAINPWFESLTNAVVASSSAYTQLISPKYANVTNRFIPNTLLGYTPTVSSLSDTGNWAVGTSTPTAKLSLWGDGTGTGLTVDATNAASTTLFQIQDNGTAYFLGNLGIGTSTPGSLLSLNNIANFTAATSTFYSTGGINLTSGCFAIGGSCIGAGGSSLPTPVSIANGGTGTSTASTNALPYWTSTYLAGNPSLLYFDGTSFGVGTSTPWGKLSVQANDNASIPQLVIASSTNISLLIVNSL